MSPLAVAATAPGDKADAAATCCSRAVVVGSYRVGCKWEAADWWPVAEWYPLLANRNVG